MFHALDAGSEGFKRGVDCCGCGCFHLIHFVEHDDEWGVMLLKPENHVRIKRGERNTGVDNEHGKSEYFRVLKIVGDHGCESLALRFGRFCVAVSRKIDKIKVPVEVVQVDGLCAARLGAHACELFLLRQVVDHRRFAHVRSADHRDVGFAIGGNP